MIERGKFTIVFINGAMQILISHGESVMSGSAQLISENWELTPADEREIIFARLCKRDGIQKIGEDSGLDWFENNTVGYNTETEAIDLISENIDGPSAVEDALSAIEPDHYHFDWFYGKHYTVDLSHGVQVSEGPAEDQWTTIFEQVQQTAADEDRLRAFLRGIISGDSRSGCVRTKFSEAQARGNQHYSDGKLSVTHLVKEPSLITGISTRKGSNSGRSYSVAQEVAPVIAVALDQQVENESGPVTTPSQEVPDEIGRRIPKFEEVLDASSPTEEDINQFESLLEGNDAVDYWTDYIAPGVKFRDRAKKAVLCMLASPEDKGGTKGRANMIMYGPPGTGKTGFKNFLVDEFGALSIDGARVSKVDLTYNKNSGEDGLLVRAHKGLAVIEEADELDEEALGAALTALGESGQLEIRDMRLPAEVRGIMLGNYRSRQEIITKHSEALFNRFEFVIKFDRLAEEERDAAIDYQYDRFRQGKDPEETERLRKFIAWVRDFDPQISDEEMNKIKQYKQEQIDAIENVRSGIALLNIAYTIARLNHRDVTLADYQRAFELV